MLLSKTIRIASLLISAFLLSACGSMQTGTSDAPQQVAEGETGEGAAKTTDSATGLPQPNIPDPMEVDLPLDLIKGYDQVKAMLAKKQTVQAMDKLKQLQTSHPKLSGPSYRLARLLLENKRYEESLKAVEASLSINKNNYYAHNLKGVVLREQGQFQKAKQAYMSAVGTYPAHAQSHLNLGILADIYLYDLPLALKHYQTYLSLIGSEDKKVTGWVLDLQRRIPSGEK